MKTKRPISFLLILVLVASLLSGCGTPGVLPPQSESVTARKTSFFADVWRGDTPYGDMEYEHYKAEWFDEYTQPLYDFARTGGSQQDFSDVNFDLTDHLYYVYTLQNLIDLQYSADELEEAVRAAKTGKQPVRLLVKDMDVYRTLSIDYHGGLRYPVLERIEGSTDYLTPIFSARK